VLIPMPHPVRGEEGQVTHLTHPSFVARSPIHFIFTAADTDVSVAHGLGRVPEGWIAVRCSAAVTVYDGSASSSEDVLVLRATGAADVYVLPL
jgi:hypothetical protein